jgi:hypothetical protein
LTSAGRVRGSLRQLCRGGIAALSDTAERDLDDDLVEGFGGVVIEPFGDLPVVWELGGDENVESLVGARGAAIGLWWSDELAGGVAGIVCARFAPPLRTLVTVSWCSQPAPKP